MKEIPLPSTSREGGEGARKKERCMFFMDFCTFVWKKERCMFLDFCMYTRYNNIYNYLET